jgi:hypothetical protein
MGKDASDEDTKWLCSGCIGEADLCQKVESEGQRATCWYCGTEGTQPLPKLTKSVHMA